MRKLYIRKCLLISFVESIYLFSNFFFRICNINKFCTKKKSKKKLSKLYIHYYTPCIRVYCFGGNFIYTQHR